MSPLITFDLLSFLAFLGKVSAAMPWLVALSRLAWALKCACSITVHVGLLPIESYGDAESDRLQLLHAPIRQCQI